MIDQLQKNVSLDAYNTFGLAAKAQWWYEVETDKQALEFVMDNLHQSLPIRVLGGGSNILLTQDVPGVVLKNSIRGIEIIAETTDRVQVRTGAGENWHEFVLHCLDQDWGGIENLSLIPGCIGAAPIQNIGAYGVEIKDVFHQAEAIHLKTGNQRIFSHADCHFGYRDSVFKGIHKNTYLITSVTLNLNKRPRLNTSYGAIQKLLTARTATPGIRDVSEVICEIRRSKLPDPKVVGNAGSFFKNPVISIEVFSLLKKQHPEIPHYPAGEKIKIPAAWLIEACGWKGKRFGNYGVHPQQALVLVNYGGASGADIYELSEKIRLSVQDAFGISLEREVNVL